MLKQMKLPAFEGKDDRCFSTIDPARTAGAVVEPEGDAGLVAAGLKVGKLGQQEVTAGG
jgi:hypothetical protein